jgi:hypothetical protein
VHLGRRAQRVIAQINTVASELRHELLADIPAPQLRTCINVLARIRERAETSDRAYRRRMGASQFPLPRDGHDKNGNAISKVGLARRAAKSNK